MGIEESKEIWTRVDLYCDGIGNDGTTCVKYGDPNDSNVEMPMVTDCCPSAEDARRLGGVDTYRIHKMMAARVTTAR
jgi:hypothetical protein